MTKIDMYIEVIGEKRILDAIQEQCPSEYGLKDHCELDCDECWKLAEEEMANAPIV